MEQRGVRRCGAIGLADGSVRWRVWAPKADRVDLVLIDGDRRRPIPMQREERKGPEGPGFFNYTESAVPEGQRYVYHLNGGEDRPDPCSLWQPDGVAGPSAVVRPQRFEWTDRQWKGVPREDLVFYELHVGAFTPEGTFEAIIPRLASLRELGVTAIEIMPIGQFPGRRNWGYDGVLPYAAQNSYGGPQGLQKLVDAAHDAGLAVILDVVYNHFGPEGNYLAEFGPYFTDRYKTPWGSAINYDGPGSDPVRDFVLDNARMSLDEFHLDGLRLDAVHAIYDLGAKHILRAIREVADGVAERSGRRIHVVAESDLNDPRIVLPPERGGHGLDAQWSDDFHHAVHAALTGERRGYYSDFGDVRQLAAAMRQPFVYAWDYSPHRGRKHGAPADGIPGDRFVVCIQNHDQVGNRAQGDRLSTMLDSSARQRLAASLLLFSPHLPLLFMGEEYAERNPFPFFCSFCGPELIRAVREGRKREFADFLSPGEEVPDPHGEATFAAARLTWSWPPETVHSGIRHLYADLLAARRLWPALRDFANRTARVLPGGSTGGAGSAGSEASQSAILELVRGGTSAGATAGGSADGGSLHVYFNLTAARQPLPAQRPAGRPILFSSEAARYCGSRRGAGEIGDLLPFECVAIGHSGWKSYL